MSEDYKAKGYHSKSEMRRMEIMSEPPREWKIFGALALPKGGAAYDSAVNDPKYTDAIEKSAFERVREERDELELAHGRLAAETGGPKGLRQQLAAVTQNTISLGLHESRMRALEEQLAAERERHQKTEDNLQEAWRDLDQARAEVERLKSVLSNHKLYEDYQAEIDRLRDMAEKLAGVLEGLRQYAVNIQGNHVDECTHGAGYSLLGQLAQQVDTDAQYALAEWTKFKERK